MIRKVVGKTKEIDPLKKLDLINKSLKQLGCSSHKSLNKSHYRKIVGRMK